MSKQSLPDQVSPTKKFEDFDRKFEAPDAALYDTRSEVEDWKLADMEPAMEVRDEMNPFPTTDGSQKSSAGHSSDFL